MSCMEPEKMKVADKVRAIQSKDPNTPQKLVHEMKGKPDAFR